MVKLEPLERENEDEPRGELTSLQQAMVVLVMEEYKMDPVGMAGKNIFYLIRLCVASHWLSSAYAVMRNFTAYHSKREAAAAASSIHPPLQQPEDFLGKLSSVLFIRSGLVWFCP